MSDGKIVIDIEAEGDAAVRELNDVERAAADIQGGTKKASAGIGDMVKAMGLVKIASAAFGVLKNSMGAAISRFDTMQKYPKVMQSLGYSADDSSKSIDKLSNGIDGLPTKLDDIVATNQRMVSISGNIDKATDATVALNNAFLASGASTDDAARGMDQYIKMLSTGKVEADNWDTLMETMPVSLTKVANAMGYMGNDAMVQLKKGLQDGNITFDQFQDKIIELGTGTGELAKLAKVNSEGIGTSFGNLKNTISKNMGNIITKVDEITQKLTGKTIAGNIDSLKYLINAAFASIIKSMDNIIPTIEKISKFVKDNATAFKILGGVIVSAVAAFVAFKTVTGVITSVTNAVQGLKTGFTLLKTALITNPFALVVAAIAALAVAMVYAYQKSETFRKKVDGIVKTFKDFSAPIGDVLKGIQLLAKAFKAIVLNDFSTSVSDLHDQFVKLFPESLWKGMTSFAQKVKGVVQAISTLVKGFKAIAFNDLSGSLADLKADFTEVLPESLWNGMAKLATGIRNLVKGFKDGSKGIDPFKIAFVVLKSVVLGLLGPFGLVIKAVSLVAKALGGGDVQKGIQSILTAFSGLTTGIQTNAPLIGQSVGKALQGILTAIGAALPGIIVGGLQIIKGLVLGLAQGLPLITGAAIQLIMSFTGSMLALIPVVGAAATAIIVSILTTIATNMPRILIAGSKVLLSFITGITKIVPELVTATVSLVVTYLNTIASNLGRIINAGANLLVQFINGMTKQVPRLVTATVNLIVAFLDTVSKNIGRIISSAVNLMNNFVDGLIKKMPDIVSSATKLIVSFLNEISNNLQDVIDAGVELVVKLVQGIGDNIDDIVKAAGDLVDDLVQGIIDIADRMAKAAVRLINGLAEGIRENAPLVKSAANNLLDAILESIPGGSLLKVGKDLASGLAEGIGAGISWVTNAAKDLAGKAVSSAKKALDSHSPSKVFIKIGKDTGAGMAIGIDDGSKVAIKSSKDMATDVIEASNRAIKLSSRAKAGFSRLNVGVGKTAGLATAAQMITNAVTNNSNSSTKNSNNKAEVNIYTEVKSNTPTERELARQAKVQLRDLGYSFG